MGHRAEPPLLTNTGCVFLRWLSERSRIDFIAEGISLTDREIILQHTCVSEEAENEAHLVKSEFSNNNLLAGDDRAQNRGMKPGI